MDLSLFLDRLEDALRADQLLDIVRYTNEHVATEIFMEALSQAFEVAFQIKDYDYDWLSHQLDSTDLPVSAEWKIATVRAIYKTATQFERPFLGSKLRITGVDLADLDLRDESDRFSLGLTVGNYTILDRIGQGGALVVYRGVQSETLRSVSVRVPRHFGEKHKAFLDTLRREFRVLQDLAKKNLPGVQHQIEWLEFEGVPISVCEYIEGETLSKLNHPITDPREALEIVAQASEIVHQVHECGHIHGDIKLDNLLRSGDGAVTLIDFNVSLPLDPTVDRSPPYSGTLSSMGLESIAGSAAEIDVRRDVYALGALLYELVEKKSLVQGGTREDAFVALAILPIKHEPLFSESTPSAIRSIVEFAISRDVNGRFESCQDLADACRHAVTNLQAEIKPQRDLSFLVFRIGRSIGEITRRVEILLPLSQKIAEQGSTKGIERAEQFEILGFASLGEERRNIIVLSNQASLDIRDPDPSDFFGAVVIRIGRATKEYLTETVERLTHLVDWCTDTRNYITGRLDGQRTLKGTLELGLLVGYYRESVTSHLSFQRLKDEFELTELCIVVNDILSDERISDIPTRIKSCEDQVRYFLQNAKK